ncbi:hypothetical protein FRC06_001363 [Ceratobasidium sp. 370]|nr:hypothetical protein FRC06_001363 [Ceratobasidium sp. 370]
MEKATVLQSTTLERIVGPQQLPHGKEHCTEMYMLLTINVDESTYSGNIQVICLTLEYLRLLNTKEKRNRLVLGRKIPWTGDQMTSLFCNGAQFFLNEAKNPITRLEPYIFMFSGFHCEMALASGTFEKSRGTSSGAATFARDTILLSRTGLNVNMNKKRPDFHTVDKFLLHELEARLRSTFLLEAGCASEEELVAWVESHMPEEVLTLAENVYTNHIANSALNNLTLSGSTNKLRPSIICTNANLLRYYAYRHVNKHRRIDRIKDLLPELLIFFAGSGNSNYAKELYYFLQLLMHECTADLKSAILKHCLLVNMQGRHDSFYPVDQHQEHNNAGIRNYGPTGANVTWEQHQKVAPAIPYFIYNIQHIEGKIAGQRRSHIHKDPKRKADIQTLMRAHNAAQIHTEVAGRNMDSKDKTKDCLSAGTQSLKDCKLAEYAANREIFFKAISDENIYSSDDDDNNNKSKAMATDAMGLVGSSAGDLGDNQESIEKGIGQE